MIDLSRDLVWSLDPVAWCVDRLRITPDPWQCDVLRSDGRRIGVCASRQSGKTVVTAAKAAHKAIYSPGSLILCVAPALRQSQLWFSAALGHLKKVNEGDSGDVLESENVFSTKLRNGSRVVALPAEPAKIRGFSAPAMIIVDEAAFLSEGDIVANDQRIFSALTPMLAVSNGQLILISSANGRVGMFADAFLKPGDDWERHVIPVTLCPRISKEFLEAERRSKTEAQFQQEYHCQWASSDASFIDFNLVLGARNPKVKALWSETDLARIAAGVRA